MFLQSSVSGFGNTKVPVGRCQSALEQPGAELRAEAGLEVLAFHNQNESGFTDFPYRVFVDDV